MLFPLSSICSSRATSVCSLPLLILREQLAQARYVGMANTMPLPQLAATRRACAHYSMASSRTMFTNSSKPRSVPTTSLSFFMSTQIREPMHLSTSSAVGVVQARSGVGHGPAAADKLRGSRPCPDAPDLTQREEACGCPCCGHFSFCGDEWPLGHWRASGAEAPTGPLCRITFSLFVRLQGHSSAPVPALKRRHVRLFWEGEMAALIHVGDGFEVFQDVTDLVKDAADALDHGELLVARGFALGEAMNVIELMHPRMDPGMREHEPIDDVVRRRVDTGELDMAPRAGDAVKVWDGMFQQLVRPRPGSGRCLAGGAWAGHAIPVISGPSCDAVLLPGWQFHGRDDFFVSVLAQASACRAPCEGGPAPGVLHFPLRRRRGHGTRHARPEQEAV